MRAFGGSARDARFTQRAISLAVPAMRATFPGTPMPEAMGDKNPKAKRKQQAQHELHKKHKAEENQRHQQRLHDLHEMKHPHEPQG